MFHCLVLPTEQFTQNLPLQSSLAVNTLHILSQSLLYYLLAYNLFNSVIHYFPIIRRKGHILLITCINLNLIDLMFSMSQVIIILKIFGRQHNKTNPTHCIYLLSKSSVAIRKKNYYPYLNVRQNK